MYPTLKKKKTTTKPNRIPAGKQSARCSWKSQLKEAVVFINRQCQPLHAIYFLIKEMR